jgi:hypothetical protein
MSLSLSKTKWICLKIKRFSQKSSSRTKKAMLVVDSKDFEGRMQPQFYAEAQNTCKSVSTTSDKQVVLGKDIGAGIAQW